MKKLELTYQDMARFSREAPKRKTISAARSQFMPIYAAQREVEDGMFRTLTAIL